MNTTHVLSRQVLLILCANLTLCPALPRRVIAADQSTEEPAIRIGIIGLDTSHVIHFTKPLNDPQSSPQLAGCRIVVAYPKGSPDIESSVSRVPKYTEQVEQMGVEIVLSIEELISRVDAVMLTTNDGRPHLQQVLPVLRAGKRTFIDKPMAGSLADVLLIFEAAEHFDTPVFSSSALRFGKSTLAVRHGAIGEVQGCSTYGPCGLEKTHPDFFWYGVHGVESLFTVMGVGCRSVTRVHTPDTDVAVGMWNGGRIGSYRGLRSGAKQFGGTAFGTTTIESVGQNEGYESLLEAIVDFFRGGEPPVTPEETIEIFAFMEAADVSKRLGGVPVALESVLTKAREEAARKRCW